MIEWLKKWLHIVRIRKMHCACIWCTPFCKHVDVCLQGFLDEIKYANEE